MTVNTAAHMHTAPGPHARSRQHGAADAAAPRRLRPAVGALMLALTAGLASPPGAAFTQSGAGVAFGNGIPMGHEWVTRLAGLELLGGDPIMPPDPNDPRRGWRQGLATNTNLSGAGNEVARIRAQALADQRYQSTYKVVFDAIVGERWVDLGGFNVAKAKMDSTDCWDVVAQEAVEVQYDHFMRRYDDVAGQGGVTAAQQSQQRFHDYFVAAAMAAPGAMLVWDGGGYSSQVEVDRNYFLFGRAVHLFQDSFSSEHTVRIPDDNYTTVRQVKSYLCAPGSEQHNHSMSSLLDYSSGDVIWNPGTQLSSGWAGYKPSNMKTTALVGTEGSKDLWAAFIRTMALPRGPQRAAAADAEARQLIATWLSFQAGPMQAWYDADGHRDRSYVLAAGQGGPGKTVAQCMKELGYASGTQAEAVNKFAAGQRTCLYNVVPVVGYSDLFDTSMHMPYNWEWRANTWQTPPADWTIPTPPADSGRQVRIRSANGQYLGAPDGVANNNWVYVRPGIAPLDLVLVGSSANAVYRVAQAPALFLSYTQATGAVKLYNSPSQANYQLMPQANGTLGIYSLYWNNWMWLSNQSPYITRAGNPANANAQWQVE